MPGAFTEVRPEHPSVGEGHGGRAAATSNNHDGGRMFEPNLLLATTPPNPGEKRESAQGMDADGAGAWPPHQHDYPTNVSAPPDTVPPGGCVPLPPGGTVSPTESPLRALDAHPLQPFDPSLVRQSITQQSPDTPATRISPIAVNQGLPGMTAAQYTLSDEVVYPRWNPPQTQADAEIDNVNHPSQLRLTTDRQERLFCQAGGWTQGTCEHETKRWVRLPCKKRACPVCGDLRRQGIARRISHGVKALGGREGAAWFVGTFPNDLAKSTAVKIQGKFVRWIRKRLGPDVQYAATWETTKSGRLHVNLLLAPWRFVPQAELSQAWQRFGGGKVVWIQRVGAGIGVEAAKSRSQISSYVGKWEQMVITGRAVCYSKGWPKPPTDPLGGRQGTINWKWQGELEWPTLIFEIERDRGLWREESPGEWKFAYGEECYCFERTPPACLSAIGTPTPGRRGAAVPNPH